VQSEDRSASAVSDSSTHGPTTLLVERDATDADYDVLWRLHVDTMCRHVAATYGWVDAVQEKLFREAWQWKAGQRVIVTGGVIVANWLVMRRAEDLLVAFIRVASSHQRRGIGTAILRRALEDAASLRVPVRLDVMKANLDAQRLYRRLGFGVEGESPTHLHMVTSMGSLADQTE
jgi:GNAT superfamily N-acetyltransferase